MENLDLEQRLEIGTVVAPQGLRGELRVYPNSDFPERFEQPGKRWLQSPKSDRLQVVELLSGRYLPGKKLYVVKLAGVNTRTDAEALRGYKLLVDRRDRPHLEEDEYHVSDLLGLEVYNQLTRETIGVVTDVFGAGNDLLAVKLSPLDTPQHKSATVLIPFVKEIVPVVDIQRGRLEITPPLGLLEVNQ
ncbi:MAG: ribosome maturation factor RimM [Cyanophyceae cyanobacterium]